MVLVGELSHRHRMTRARLDQDSTPVSITGQARQEEERRRERKTLVHSINPMFKHKWTGAQLGFF
jgi:hypothetical protein